MRTAKHYWVLFTELRRLGQIEGQNLTVERYAKEQNPLDSTAFAAQVVRSNPDVIFVLVPLSVFIKDTSKIPIVTITGDPVAAGYVQSLAHPGGNITGVSVDAGPSIHGKRIALFARNVSIDVEAGLHRRPIFNGNVGWALRCAPLRTPRGVSRQPAGRSSRQRNNLWQRYRAGRPRWFGRDHDAGQSGCACEPRLDRAVNRDTRIPAIHAITSAVDAGGLMAYAFDLKEVVDARGRRH